MIKLKSPFKRQITTSSSYSSLNMNFQYRVALSMISLLCTIILLTEPTVAYTVLPQTHTVAVPLNESLVEILPDDNVSSNSRLQERSFNQTDLTPGQRVINAVPDKERNDFILHQLTVALKRIYDNKTQRRYFNNLDDLLQYYAGRITALEKVPIYENFPTDLLRWVGQEFNLSHPRIFVQLRSRTEIWCTPQGICYAYGSGMGCYCCPF